MDIKAITFDTGGTVLDWHGGLFRAFEQVGKRAGLQRDWHTLANDYRRQAMKEIMGQIRPAFNMDDVHRSALEQVLANHGLDAVSQADRSEIFNAWRELSAWPDFPAALAQLKQRFTAISFTMLPLSLVVEVSKQNAMVWDALISCEMIGAYKPCPEAYLTCAKWIGLDPANILMVACHNFDLDAARACGFRTAFIRRPLEWGPAGPPDPVANPECDFVEDGFAELAQRLLDR
jgi:2-haloacid dehalogenase